MANKRAMRVIVFFDLPTTTSRDHREYARFRKNLLELGFSMLQYSVYSKIVLNHTQKDAVEKSVENIITTDGGISILSITESQFQKMKWLRGETKSDLLQTYDRLVVA